MKTTILAALLALVALPASAREKPPVEAEKYEEMPWHLVDIWWDLGRDVPFQSYSIEVTIADEVPARSSLYIAPIGLGHLGKIPFYGGIQTQVDGHTRKDRRLRKLGPGFLFSMWEERSLDAIRPSIGGYCQSSGHEGDFVSVRQPYGWHKGKYTYKIARMDREDVEGKPHTWVGAFVYSHQKDENVFVGALRFPGDDLVLSRKLASFVEVYGPAIPATEIPRVKVAFGNLVVNGKPAEVASAEAVYPEGVPDYAEASAEGDGLTIEVGRAVEGRRERTVRLLPAEVKKP